jgi:hypothetical protein
MTHDIHDAISLELARRVSARLRETPSLLDVARENLDRWSRLNSKAPSLLRCYAEWREILSHPVEEVCAVLCADTEDGRRLRQNSPFAGVLSAREVWEIKAARRHHATTPA